MNPRLTETESVAGFRPATFSHEHGLLIVLVPADFFLRFQAEFFGVKNWSFQNECLARDIDPNSNRRE